MKNQPLKEGLPDDKDDFYLISQPQVEHTLGYKNLWQLQVYGSQRNVEDLLVALNGGCMFRTPDGAGPCGYGESQHHADTDLDRSVKTGWIMPHEFIGIRYSDGVPVTDQRPGWLRAATR